MTVPDIEDLIMHRAPMRLLDRAISIDPQHAVAELTVREDIPFVLPGRGMPAYAGLELMAQTIGMIDGFKCWSEGLPPKIGFLLGCRRYTVACDAFAVGSRLIVSVEMVFNGGEMFSFECRIADPEGRELASAMLNVFAPRDPQAFLRDGAP
ncbi:3-hydroxyacyl-ACP dehydratase [Rhizomicrobium electricum]|uniref:Hotdog family protein n=1 Tax=Rhizomicrobium electricum TaxID=480070 RepID=A0ABN1ERH9_9PROT|nr:3-hydroxyacyl-ACP dehydratase [Rhizomicrobium electricum]NIJ49005.1 putative hotdog family 3-hydroxylacyl-ACP dehydratase [Rhizomicrobium electricum]